MNETIWISAGEISGDMHAADLAAALTKLRPDLRLIGMGGPHLRSLPNFAGKFRVEDLSVMGLGEVITQLPRILLLLSHIKGELRRNTPAALIAVDAPSFNFRVIRMARALKIPVYYHISPKIWAWKQNRAYFLKENVRRLFSILPFEREFYRRFGMDIDYVGNPLVDMIPWADLEGIQTDPNLIGVLPGSRKKEIRPLMPEFAKAAALMLRDKPFLRFACAQAPGVEQEYLRQFWPADIPLRILPPEERYALMRKSVLLLAASGTVTLESALIGTPTIVAYKVSALTWIVGRALVRIPWVSLPNLILGREVFPELLQGMSRGEVLAGKALSWLSGARTLESIREDILPLRTMLGLADGGTAAGRAAGIIIEDLDTINLQT